MTGSGSMSTRRHQRPDRLRHMSASSGTLTPRTRGGRGSRIWARRHRVLLARTIAEQPPGKLAHLLGRANRSRALNLPLPSHVAQVDRLLSREEPAAVLRAIQAAPPDPFARRPDDGAAGLAPAGQAAITAVREVAIAGELLTRLVGEFQPG